MKRWTSVSLREFLEHSTDVLAVDVHNGFCRSAASLSLHTFEDVVVGFSFLLPWLADSDLFPIPLVSR